MNLMVDALRGLLSRLWARSLQREVHAHLPVLPMLRTQLEQTSAEMERSVVEVCGNFQGIVANARENVANSKRALGAGDDSAGGLEAALSDSQSTIEHLLQRMERSTEVSLAAVERMGEVETALARINQAIQEVDKIAFTNQMLALNAKIEAVHVGDQGAGFGVVADEISMQARKSNEITEQIGETVRGLGAAIVGAAGQLREMASHDRENLGNTRAEVRAALDHLRQAHLSMRAAVERAGEGDENLAQDISNAVQTLQFQDRLTQRIGHVVEALADMETAFRSHGERPGGAGGDDARRSQVIENLDRACTMQAERAVLTGTVHDAAVEAGDVELF